MLEKNKEWEDYLLNDQAEINRKLATSKDEQIDIESFGVLREEVERTNPEYQLTLKEAVNEILIATGEPIERISKEDIVHWLLSLGD